MTDEQFIKKLYNSKLYKLAQKQLVREGKAEVHIDKNNIKIYSVDPLEVIIKGLEIIRLSQQKGIKI